MIIDAGAVAAGASATPAATHAACGGLLNGQRREPRSKKRERKGRRCRASKDTAAKQEPAKPGAMIASRSQISSSPRHTHAASRIFQSKQRESYERGEEGGGRTREGPPIQSIGTVCPPANTRADAVHNGMAERCTRGITPPSPIRLSVSAPHWSPQVRLVNAGPWELFAVFLQQHLW